MLNQNYKNITLPEKLNQEITMVNLSKTVITLFSNGNILDIEVLEIVETLELGLKLENRRVDKI